MNDRQKRTVETFRRVLIHFELYPPATQPPLFVDACASLTASIQRIEELARAQADAEWDMKGNVERRKDVLRTSRMRPLKRIGAKKLKFSPAEGALQVPHKRADAQTVAAAALRMADAMEPFPELIEAAGHPPDFLAQMRREAHDLQLSARRSESARNRRSLATTDLAREVAEGMETLTELEGLVMTLYGTDKQRMAQWKDLRRVRKRMGRPRRRKSSGDDPPSAHP